MSAAFVEAAGLVLLAGLVYVGLPVLWVRYRPDLYGWWHATRVAETLRWHRDGWSWSVAWVRSSLNVHDGEDWSHLGTGVER